MTVLVQLDDGLSLPSPIEIIGRPAAVVISWA